MPDPVPKSIAKKTTVHICCFRSYFLLIQINGAALLYKLRGCMINLSRTDEQRHALSLLDNHHSAALVWQWLGCYTATHDFEKLKRSHILFEPTKVHSAAQRKRAITFSARRITAKELNGKVLEERGKTLQEQKEIVWRPSAGLVLCIEARISSSAACVPRIWSSNAFIFCGQWGQTSACMQHMYLHNHIYR